MTHHEINIHSSLNGITDHHQTHTSRCGRAGSQTPSPEVLGPSVTCKPPRWQDGSFRRRLHIVLMRIKHLPHAVTAADHRSQARHPIEMVPLVHLGASDKLYQRQNKRFGVNYHSYPEPQTERRPRSVKQAFALLAFGSKTKYI